MKNTVDFSQIWSMAYEAGTEAGNAAQCTPMIITEEIGPNPGQQWMVPDGPCGFAEIKFAGNTQWGRWAKKERGCTKAYPKGLHYWVGEFGQSYTRKSAFAIAFAKVLNNYGIDCYTSSRLD